MKKDLNNDLENQQNDLLDEDLKHEFEEEFKKDEIVEEILFSVNAMNDSPEEDTVKEVESVDLNEYKITYDDLKKNNKKILFKSIVASGIASLVIAGGIVSLNENKIAPTAQITIKDHDVDNVYKVVATKATPSVVGITTLTVNTNNFFNLPLESEGVGSGVIVDKRGYILTNSHVVSDGKATKVSVIFSDASSVDGKVLWNDAKLDLAIVKVEKSNLEVAELGDSDDVEVGDISIAIGNPLGLEFNKTVTQGIISGLGRTITTENGEMTDLMQTDASINPGNSGGPLLNSKGQVIGINTAKVSGAEGLGFSIPINVAKPIIEQVISNGDFKKVTLGVKGFDASQFELSTESGVYVIEVEDNSPAKKAGVSSGDIIIGIDNKEVKNMSDLTKSLYTYKAGDKAKIKIYKDGVEREVEVQF